MSSNERARPVPIQTTRKTSATGGQSRLKDLRDLYPHLSDPELRRSRDNLERYLLLAVRIFERLREENLFQGSNVPDPIISSLTPQRH